MRTEFEFISGLKSKYNLSKVGDDCAVIPKDAATDLVITADMLLQDVDFRLDWSTSEQIGHRALAVSLSDIAAMGAQPQWAMISIAVPGDLWASGFPDGFFSGWQALAGRFNVELIGGDISRSPTGVVVDSVAAGEVPKGSAFRRSGARPGDGIFVSGTLGGSGGGLRLLERGTRESALTQKHLQPEPQIELAKQLHDLHLVTSAIDISDGISVDLGHICKAGEVGALIRDELLPIHPSLSKSFSQDECLDLALHAGEDYELLFTGPSDLEVEGVTRIGVITDRPGIVEIEIATVISRLEPRGYRHF